MKRAKFFERWICAAALALLCAVMPSPAAAASSSMDVTARVGFDAFSEVEDFDLYEVNGRMVFSPYITWGDGWTLTPALVCAVSLLHAADDTGIMAGFGPQLELTFPWDRLTAFATVRPSGLTEHEYGREDLGGWFTLATDVGARIDLGSRIMVGYAWEHISNANLYDNNPGLNFHVIELGLKF
ncbi:acyloxyacyl hydrolase [Desulfococcus sp.]|uniref:acyloxyacyl hydrolase n=1 Tax=Desulfococcus sp. TaxID=2025834 RepID=UPI0035945B95